MNVDTVYKIIQYITAKNQQGYVAPADFNLMINAAQNQYLDYLLGEFQQYQPGRAVPRVQFGMNETIRQSLTPLIDAPSPLLFSFNGFSAYTSDFQQVDAIYWGPNNERVRFASQDRFDSYLNSVIDPIASNPIYILTRTGFQFYPITMNAALISYVKTPASIVWAYTPNIATGNPDYDPANSVDPVWFDSDMDQIIARSLLMIGVNLQASMVSQYASAIKNTGA